MFLTAEINGLVVILKNSWIPPINGEVHIPKSNEEFISYYNSDITIEKFHSTDLTKKTYQECKKNGFSKAGEGYFKFKLKKNRFGK